MVGWIKLLLLALYLSAMLALSDCGCPEGFNLEKGKCIDEDECNEDYPGGMDLCGKNADCVNTIGGFDCMCEDGFQTNERSTKFAAESSLTCKDVNECLEENTCGPNARCINTAGSYDCVSNAGFAIKSGGNNFTLPQEPLAAVCSIDETNHCGNGTCHIGTSGPYCACQDGFTNYGNKAARCTALDCDAFKDTWDVKENPAIAPPLLMQLKQKCEDLTKGEDPEDLDHHDLLWRLLLFIDQLLFSGALNENRKVSTFLDLVESALNLIGPFIDAGRICRSYANTELDLLTHKGAMPPQGVAILSTKPVTLNIPLETVSGDPSLYPGFASVSLLSYANLENFTDGFFSGMNPQANESFVINSKVVTVSVTNTNTSHTHGTFICIVFLQGNGRLHLCVFWKASHGNGSWSADGCTAVESNSEFTVCSCNHLSTFAVLMALYDVEATFELQVVTWVGLSLSLICLLICILTFSLIRSIQSPRTTIHLHLCISLFVAVLIFLVGISHTENQNACAVIAGLLHYFFLAAFCWMCLEGVQLFRMVILVFNTNFRTLYMMAGGYGVPAAIVAISALINPKGYGTQRHCWLNVDFIWSFLGPVCVIIAINVFFFLITAWKLVQKFSSLNPDLNTLQKINAFTVTAVAQLCVLGTTWIFGCFQFEKSTMVMSYLFTIFASLQGLMLFVLHCLFSKQVRDEYGNLLSRFNAPPKKSYSDFSSFPSKQQASKSSEDTRESHI